MSRRVKVSKAAEILHECVKPDGEVGSFQQMGKVLDRMERMVRR